jgi:transcriptional regulator GlxA family with amidase domain
MSCDLASVAESVVRIEILLFDGFDELDALAPFEVFKCAEAAGADFTVRLVSSSQQREFVAAHGLRVVVDSELAGAEKPELVVVPGGGWICRSPQGARAEVDRGVIPTRLAELHQAGATIGAVCTGSMLLAATGLLGGRPAITHHGAIDELRAQGAEVIDARVVDDGDFVTSGGVTSGLDLALWLVERYAGPVIAHSVERELEYERRGVVWRRAADASKV